MDYSGNVTTPIKPVCTGCAVIMWDPNMLVRFVCSGFLVCGEY